MAHQLCDIKIWAKGNLTALVKTEYCHAHIRVMIGENEMRITVEKYMPCEKSSIAHIGVVFTEYDENNNTHIALIRLMAKELQEIATNNNWVLYSY